MMKSKLIHLLVLTILLISAGCSTYPDQNPGGTGSSDASFTAQPPTALPGKVSPSARPPADSLTKPPSTPDTAVQTAAKATNEASEFFETVDKLKADGVISESQGIYYRLDDIDQTAALRGEYFWIPTNYSPQNFVLRTDVTWQSADRNADWSVSGPGFLFRETDNKRFFAVFLRLNGQADLYRIDVENDTFFYVSNKKVWNTAKPDGNVVLMLAVENDKVNLFIDDVLVIEDKDIHLTSPNYNSGRLNFAIASGTNKDFGTRIIFSNIELWELGNPEQLASSALGTSPQTPPPTSTLTANDPLTEQGIQAFLAGDLENAVLLLSKAINANPNYNNPDGYITRGRAYYALKQYPQAIADFNNAVRFAPIGAKIYLYRGYAYEKMKNNTKALADYNTVIRLDPNDVWAYRSRAMIYIAQKKYSDALNDLDKAIRLADDSAATYNNRCWLKYLLKDYAEALPDCDKALDIEPDNLNYLESRAFVYKALEQNHKALADFERILSLTEDEAIIVRIKGEIKKLPSP